MCINCPACGAPMAVGDDAVFKRRCPACGAVLQFSFEPLHSWWELEEEEACLTID